MERLRHDVAFATSLHILNVFSPLLREEERRVAFTEILECVKAGLDTYEERAERLTRRLKPLPN
jgi:hypothetical protein